MSARIELANFALAMIGEPAITSLDDDSDRARTIKIFYYVARDALLEDANWTFATRRFAPALNAAVPDFGWNFAYTIPSDIVRVVNVLRDWGGATLQPYNAYDYPEEYKSAHVIEGNEILSNDNPIYCYGIVTMENEGAYSPLFAEAFAAKLATLCAIPLAASAQKMQLAAGIYVEAIKKAKTRDGMQNTTRRMRNRTLFNAR